MGFLSGVVGVSNVMSVNVGVVNCSKSGVL